MCYGQLNGDAIQNLLSFLPFFFLTHFPFVGTTRLTRSDDDDRSLDSRWSMMHVQVKSPF